MNAPHSGAFLTNLFVAFQGKGNGFAIPGANLQRFSLMCSLLKTNNTY
jgi:hypothetical protein